MTPEQWLHEATRGLPRAVVMRVQTETLAHLQEAGLGEGDDITALLGPPATTRKALGRLYVSAAELDVLGRDRVDGWLLSLVMLGVLAVGLLFWGAWTGDPHLPTLGGVAAGLGLLALTAAWTHYWRPEQRRQMRANMGLCGMMLFQIVLPALSNLPLGLLESVSLCLWGGLFLTGLIAAQHSAQKLRRTLALKGVRV
ncbi:hypothetical protein [Deinococcus multiflagellatus]|uniref:DUF2157 domain-containing protein n=1 Tax=Deinococcus multiflagellatus TaxID=1656887 RepID=A0ABW1ZL80_9DEIO|nr:hypothetical protein [Deinococcus multiflagellatus]MBZ9712276.1 hypothetical protein [Deinococcus multiflagellatus]